MTTTPPSWVLQGVLHDGEWDNCAELTRCVEIDGLFVDLPPRDRERFTLLGCRPAGALADLLDRLPAEALGTEAAWLGHLSVTAPEPPAGQSPQWFGEDLLDVVVLGQRPSAATPGAVDIDLDGFVFVYEPADEVERPADVAEFALVGYGEAAYGTCQDVSGVFREQGEPPVPVVRLLGCRPTEPLLTAVAALEKSGPEAWERRRIRADVEAVLADGSTINLIGGMVHGYVEACTPSSLGEGLLDVTVDSCPVTPLPTGYLDLLAHWRAGRPTEKNTWAGFSSELRHHWAGLALSSVPKGPDRPPGGTYHLDGRFVTDVHGFFCALGEAVNGPGGYYGWNFYAVHDCLTSAGFGARGPFRLIWHDSAVAREHLAPSHDPRTMAFTLDDLVASLTEDGVGVELR
ncbi:barstar family protein [Actinoplanes sp. NEAU-A12]|uniref:Barstar family protein n=1 Tax=Actinoplanes sandaracinus TaxID=3045177 RepID=A0ABT6WRJ7_9ACTN|nr:barstar family protein [Actinoplanes sandaracinus]MDI6102306.1 barstar family protein [Actinoplanes sandaracinus]